MSVNRPTSGARPPAGGTALALGGVEVRRGGRLVLRIPSLSVPAGEALAVLGPNGAGKSTLLSILAGIERPAAGSATIGGEAADRLAARRRVALVPQDAPMLAGTVRENVALPLTLRGVASAERHRRAQAALERMGVGGLAGRPAAAVSGGEARRVALARAMVTEPDALLLDEPFAALDPPTRERLLADVAGLRGAGATLVVVTQSRDEALRLGERWALVWDGEIAQEGAPEAVLAAPRTPAMAAFLGLENVLRGTVAARTADGVVVDLGPARLTAAAADRPAVGRAVWIAIGPERIDVRRAPAGESHSARNVLPARVRSVRPREGRVEIDLDAGIPLIATVTRAAVEELGLSEGTAVEAVIKATACHLIEAGAGRG